MKSETLSRLPAKAPDLSTVTGTTFVLATQALLRGFKIQGEGRAEEDEGSTPARAHNPHKGKTCAAKNLPEKSKT